MTVSDMPHLAVTIDIRPRQAAYVNGAGTEVLTFCYVVQAADRVGEFIFRHRADAERRPHPGGGMDARRPHAAMPTDAGRKVDGRVSASATVRLDVPEGKTG